MREARAFVSDDGRVFMDQEECLAHEGDRRWNDSLKLFLDSEFNPYEKGRATGIARKAIVAWEKWKEANIEEGN